MQMHRVNQSNILAPSVKAVEDLTNIEPGVVQCYYRGFIAKDVQEGKVGAAWARSQAQMAYTIGAVELVQRRLGENNYEYLAIGKTHPRTGQPTFDVRPVVELSKIRKQKY